MKKILALVLCLTALVMLPGFSFSAEKQVPDKSLEWAVEDYLEGLELGEPENTEVEIEHDLDEPTHTDTVTIHVSAEYPGLTATSSCVTTYEYNKATDLWSVIRGGKWEPLRVTEYRLSIDTEECMEALERLGEDPDYDELGSEELFFEDGWMLELFEDSEVTPDAAGWEIWSSQIGIIKLEFTEPDDFEQYFDGFAEGLVSNWVYAGPEAKIQEEANITGENYDQRSFRVKYSFNDPDKEEIYHILRVGQTVYIFYLESDPDEMTEDTINAFLRSFGFLPEAR